MGRVHAVRGAGHQTMSGDLVGSRQSSWWVLRRTRNQGHPLPLACGRCGAVWGGLGRFGAVWGVRKECKLAWACVGRGRVGVRGAWEGGRAWVVGV